ncbi:unnamed protein product [Rotaria sp. Silwood1]|nr:unnamed protein product [Rotaria sp. Silwood1]
MISLNVQWVPVTDRSGTYQWSGNDVNNRKVKTVTFFGTGEMRGQKQRKSITPPSSDYTDAYLSAFAPKPIPTRHVNRLSTAVFANVAPIPLKPISPPLPKTDSMKTSQTRFININNIQPSKSFDKFAPSSSSQSSTYSSSLTSERSTTYEPFSNTQYSSPQSQTFTSSYSTLLRTPMSTTTVTPTPSFDSRRSYTTIQPHFQPISSTVPIVSRSETSYGNIYRPLPPYSFESYPPSNTYTTSLSTSLSSIQPTYRPQVPFQSPSLFSSYNINQSSLREPLFRSTTKMETQIDRPETLSSQRDEDTRSSRIEEPSPIINPSPQSSITREELKIEPERLHMEELTDISSEPIRILESTLDKYDSLINQISEVLASVSPMSSTVSSMSPGKSVLDYQLSSDSSPISPASRTQIQPSEQSMTTMVTTSTTVQTKPSHLIRRDSYDKIVTAISDIDKEILSSADTQISSATIKEQREEPEILLVDAQQVPPIAEKEDKESKTASTEEHQTPSILTEQKEEQAKALPTDEQQVSSATEEEKQEAKVSLVEEHPAQPITEKPDEETKTVSTEEHQLLSISPEHKEDEAKVISTDEQQAPAVAEEKKGEETKTVSVDEQQTLSITQEEKPEVKTSLADEQQVSPITEKQDKEIKDSSIQEHQAPSISIEQKGDEAKTLTIDEQQAPAVAEEKKGEETKTASVDEQQTLSTTQEEKLEVKTSLVDEQQVSPITEKEGEEIKTIPTEEHHISSILTEHKEEEAKVSSTDVQQAPSLTDEEKQEETKISSIDEQQTHAIIEEEKKDETTTTSVDEHPSTTLIEEKAEEPKGSSSEKPQLPSASPEEKVETATTLTEMHQVPSATDKEKEEAKVSISSEQEAPTIPEEVPSIPIVSSSDTSASEILQSHQLKSDEEKVTDQQSTAKDIPDNANFVQQETVSLTNVPYDVAAAEETSKTTDSLESTKKTGKRVTWDEAVVDNEDAESSSQESLSEESGASETSTTTKPEENRTAATIDNEYVIIPEPKTTADQQITSSDVTESQITSDQTINLPSSTEPSIVLLSTTDQQITSADSSDFQTTSTEQQVRTLNYSDDQTSLQATINEQIHPIDITGQHIIPSDSTEQQTRSFSPLETSSTFSDSTSQEITSPDLTEVSSGVNEQQTRSVSPLDTQSVSITDSSKEDTFTVDEISTTTSDITSSNEISKHVEELEPTKTESKEDMTSDLHKIETSSQVAEKMSHESETSIIESTIIALQPTIVSPIDTLSDIIANRYISSDVYHGCLGEHKQFLQDTSDIDQEHITKSLIGSLRETITTPMIPLIETIQSVVSSLQTKTAAYPLKTDIETIDHSQDDTSLTTTIVTESKQDVSDDQTQAEENKPTMDSAEKLKTVFETLQETITAPITAITETIQTTLLNLQSDKQEISSSSSTEQLKTTLSESISTVETESPSNIVKPSDEKTTDDSNKEIEPSSPLLTETSQNIVPMAISSTDMHTEEKAIQREKSEGQAFEGPLSTDTIHEQTITDHTEKHDTVVTDSSVSTTLDTTSTATEQVHEQKEKPETIFVESSPSEIPESTSAIQKTAETTTEGVEFTPVTQYDEQVSTFSPVAVEQGDISDKQHTILTESSSTDILPTPSVDQKTEELTAKEDHTIESSIPTSITQHDESTPTPIVIPSEQIVIDDKQEAAHFEIPSETTTEQTSDANVATETKTTFEVIRDVITHPIATITGKIQSVISTSTSEQTEQAPSDATKSSTSTSEEVETSKGQQIIETENIPATEQKAETVNVESTETKTTFENIREIIAHPIATITEKIQSVMSTSPSEQIEQASSDATKPSTSTSEEIESSKDQQVSETQNLLTTEQKVESMNIESSETKTTLENIRDIITHPLATLTEKIQTVIISSTTEEVPTSEQQTSTISIDQNKSEDIKSTVTKPTFEMTQDAISNTIDQTSSHQEKKQILTNQAFESYLQDQIQGQQDLTSTTILSQISDNEKPIQQIESEYEDAQDLDSLQIDASTSDEKNSLLINIVHNIIHDIINAVLLRLNQISIDNEQIEKEMLSSDSSLTSTITVINVEDKSENSESTINEGRITSEGDTFDSKMLISNITWPNLLGEKPTDDEKYDQSFEQIKQLLEEVVQSSDSITVEIIDQKTTITLPSQTQLLPIMENTLQQTIITPQTDDIIQQLSNDIVSDSISAVTEIENVPLKSSTEFRESSPTNIEDDSLELIHALQGHSIILPSSQLVQIQAGTTNQPSLSTSYIEKVDIQTSQVPEKSSSSTTTTSSQITSSDRYVSYAIHEMGDSSQERLPAFPVAADIPIYKSVKTTSDENKEQQKLSEPIVNINQNVTKDDDLTEFDATENLTYSDDVLLQKLYTSAPTRLENLDASSTDEDADDANFNEYEHHDIPNLYRIMNEIIQQNDNLSQEYGQTYQRYDVSSNSSTSTKLQSDDVYIIPGYAGLWRPSADDDDDNTHLPLTNDEDDQQQSATTVVKTRTIVRTTDPTKLQSFLQQHQDITTQDTPVRQDTYDIFNKPLNEFSFDVSESDSFKTCTSTINTSPTSKQQTQAELYNLPIIEQKEHQTSPDEKIFLIRERERGVSLPVTMKIDYDDMALRLSSSTPIDAQLYATTPTDLPPPSTSTCSELVEQTTSSSRASTQSLSSNESEKQKISSPSWLNTTNTIITTIEGPDGRK